MMMQSVHETMQALHCVQSMLVIMRSANVCILQHCPVSGCSRCFLRVIIFSMTGSAILVLDEGVLILLLRQQVACAGRCERKLALWKLCGHVLMSY